MLPTFLVIGAMKCGTTSLYYYLADHPQIGMSRVKETDFFLDEHGHWHRGRDWYARQFPDDVEARGECAPNYTKRHLFDGVPERIQSLCPDIQLIYLVRDPVERTISHYVGSRLQGREERSFEAAVADEDHSNYVLTSKYHMQLQPYLDRFPEENLLVCATEDLKASPRATLRRMHRFLGVDPTVDSHRTEQRFNVSGMKVGGWLRRLARRMPQGLKDRLRPYVPWRWLPGKRVPRPTLSEATRARLEAILHPEAEQLRAITGQTFEAWSV